MQWMKRYKRATIHRSPQEHDAPQRNGYAMGVGTRQPTIKFGPYVIDLHAGELRKFGGKIRLQEKPLQLLAALAEQSGEVVSNAGGIAAAALAGRHVH
jgi:DNA-binding response OmpR family regulator